MFKMNFRSKWLYTTVVSIFLGQIYNGGKGWIMWEGTASKALWLAWRAVRLTWIMLRLAGIWLALNNGDSNTFHPSPTNSHLLPLIPVLDLPILLGSRVITIVLKHRIILKPFWPEIHSKLYIAFIIFWWLKFTVTKFITRIFSFVINKLLSGICI